MLVERLARAAAAASTALGALGDRAVGRALCWLWTVGGLTWFGIAFNLKHARDALNLWAALDHAGFVLLILPALPCALALALRTQGGVTPRRVSQ